MYRFSISIAVLALALGGCKKKDGAAGADQKTADKPKPVCADGALTNPDGPYCIPVPAGWVARPPRDVAGDQLTEYKKDDNSPSVGVSLRKFPGSADSFKMQLDMQDKMLASPDHKSLQSGDLPGGNGKYWSYEDNDGLWAKSIALSSKGMQVECDSRQSPTDSSPAKQALLDACKLIVVQ
ncbi:MAG TPA: hypothetical protein VLX92_06000 [Kofleriaceae bacterium]|nr:hypothetical protein [Kofleriaceae bacterium]